MPEGLKITLSGYGGGITRDKNGKELLPSPLVLQCPPLEEFKVTHAFSMGNYDTVTEGQYTRQGSRQLDVWQFDTLVMDIGVNESGTRQSPGWVPFPKFDRPGRPTDRWWYIEQLRALFNAGVPFKFSAQFQTTVGIFHEAAMSLGPAWNTAAVLLGFSETHKHGESDAIYLEGVSFQEWRDPVVSQRALGGPPASDKPPTSCTLLPNGTVRTQKHHIIPKQPKKGVKHATLTDLSRYFYHTPADWRLIANANRLKGGGGTPLIKFPRFHKIPKNGVTIKIPAVPKSNVGPINVGAAGSAVSSIL